MKKAQILVQTDGEEYLHKTIWQVVVRQIEQSNQTSAGSSYNDLVAMVFAFHCIEGYLNYIIEKTAPEIWENEKKHFGNSGIAGKLDEVIKLCEVISLYKGRRPYSTIIELKKLRDLIAHPRMHTVKESRRYPEGKEPPMFARSHLEDFVTHKKALRAQEDLEFIVNLIHNAALLKFPHCGLDPKGLGGIAAIRTT